MDELKSLEGLKSAVAGAVATAAANATEDMQAVAAPRSVMRWVGLMPLASVKMRSPAFGSSLARAR